MHTTLIRLTTFWMALLFSGLAAAESVISPGGGATSWNFYAMGNGEAIASILGAIKMMMSPDEGNSGYGTVLLFMALVGFVVLAAQAGFNPGKHLGRMFGYILVVWMIMLTTTSIKANVRVYDPVTNYDTVVTRVPALVAVPASIVSEIGVWMTRKLEDVFTVPSELTLSAGASEGLGGGYNLFGRMMSDADNYTITNPGLKRSLAAYAADCMVPAIARGKLSVSGDLLESTNMMDSLAKAKHPSILTRYAVDKASSSSCAAKITDDSPTGATMSCTEAYNCIKTDMEAHAEQLLNSSARSWSSTGVMVPYETAMAAALQYAGGGGGANAYANYARPQGFILQKSMMASMRGSFRQAAVQTGNNELLLAASISQAEQAQKTGWWTAAEVFKNLMGYIYTVLQAFLFAIVPIIIIALMIPGLGGKIFVNYSQLLIWLALWMPLLAIINYLITLFGKQDLYSIWALSGGPSMQTEWTVSEKTNNLVVAAQFLGTSVPILALGLVKGAMAFTEFVSHGIGSSLATQAGATASSGNLSMGNMSMDNVSANKYNTAASSTVGTQDVMAFTNAGSAQQTLNMGGLAATANGGSMTQALSSQQAQSVSNAASTAVGSSESAGASASANEGVRYGNSAGVEHTSGVEQGARNTVNSSTQAGLVRSGGTGDNAGTSVGVEQSAVAGQQTGASLNATGGAATSSGGGGGGGGGSGSGGKAATGSGFPAKISGGTTAKIESSESNGLMTTGKEGASGGHSANTGVTGSHTSSSGAGAETSTGWSAGHRASHGASGGTDISASGGMTTGVGTSETQQHTQTAQEQNTTAVAFNMPTQMSAMGAIGAFNGNAPNLSPAFSAMLQHEQQGLQARHEGLRSTAESYVEATGDKAQAGAAGLAGTQFTKADAGVTGPVSYSGAVDKVISGANAEVSALQSRVGGDKAALTAGVKNANDGLNPLDLVKADYSIAGGMKVQDSNFADGVATAVGASNLLNMAGSLAGDLAGARAAGGAGAGTGAWGTAMGVGRTSVASLGMGTVALGTGAALATGWAIGTVVNKYAIEGTAAADWLGEKGAQLGSAFGNDTAREALETNRRLEASPYR